MRRISLLVTACVLLVAGAATAGQDHMAEAMNCSICKPMAAHMEELGETMGRAVIPMNDGVAMYHWVTDESKAELFHSVCEKMQAAGEASASYTPAQVEENLCSFCQDIHGLMAAGASMSNGQSENGSLMVIRSDAPEVQEKIAVFAAKAQETGSS